MIQRLAIAALVLLVILGLASPLDDGAVLVDPYDPTNAVTYTP